VGKSALLDQVARSANLRILRATGAEAEATLAYALLQQLLLPVLDLAGQLLAPQAAALRVALGLESGPPADRFLVSLATLTLLSEGAGERPLLCLIDDAQWGDRASLDVLAFVARRLIAEPIALVAATRDGEQGPLETVGMEVVTVGGLQPAAAADLLEQRWGPGLAPAVRDALVGATAGNPLALAEIPRALTPEQLAGRQPLPDPLPLAGELEGVFLERVELSEPELRSVALLCAAEGSGSLPVVLRAARHLGISDPEPRLAGLGEMLRSDRSTLVFSHPLVRSAIYQGADAAARRAAHLALATALAGEEGQADRRAWHLAQVAVGPDEDVALELERSAQRGLHRSGYAAAALALERAADLGLGGERQTRRLVAAADAAWAGGDASRAGMLLDRLDRVRELPSPVRARARYLRGLIELRGGVPADALAELMVSAREAVEVDAPLALRALIAAGEAVFQAGDLEMRRQITSILARLPLDETPPSLLAHLYLSVHPATWGERPERLADFARVAELDDPELLGRAGGMALGMGAYTVARELLTRSVARARALGAATALAWALGSLAQDEIRRDRFTWAEAFATEGHRLALETGQPNLACQHEAILVELAVLRDPEDDARRLADQALAAASGRGLLGTLVTVRRALGLLALASGDADGALEHLEMLWQGPQGQRGVAMLAVPDLVEAAVRAGRPELGRERLTAYLAWVEGGPSDAAALAARAQAVLAAGEEADRWYREALHLHPAPDRPMDRARTALLYGEHLRRERRRVEARVQLRAALDTFDRLGAVRWAERARAELRATGETARRRELSTFDQLTQQELQVVRAISQGATNREAAAQLFISPRTVDHHLRNVFRKLEVRSRSELVRRVLEGGLEP
jgi:DNA-binding CsgD family transcriptional regulator